MSARTLFFLRKGAAALFWMALAGGVLMLSSGISDPSEGRRFSPATWPRMIAAGIILAALGQVAFGGTDRPDAEDEPASMRNVLAAAGLSLLYLKAIDWAGFYLATPLFLAAYLATFGERRPLRVALFSSLSSLVFFFAFTSLLFISLPTGQPEALYRLNIVIQQFFLSIGAAS